MLIFFYLLLIVAGILGWARFIPTPSGLDQEEGWGFSLVLGWTAPAFVIYLLGFLHLYFAPLILAIFFLPLVVWIYRIFRRGVDKELLGPIRIFLTGMQKELGSLLFYIALPVVLLLFLFMALSAISCDTSIDPYHVFIPLAYLRAGGIISLPGDVVAMYPKLWEMIYLVGTILDAETLPAALNVFQWFLAGYAIFLLGRHLYGAKTGLLAGFFTMLTPWPINVATMAHSDFAPVVTGIFSIYCMVRYIEDREKRWILLAGLFYSLTVICKLAGAYYLFPVYFIFLVYAVLAGKAIRGALAAVLITLAVSVPWWGYNWVQTGNPIYPAAYRFFDSGEPYLEVAKKCNIKHGPALSLSHLVRFAKIKKILLVGCIDGEGPTVLFYLFVIPWIFYCILFEKGGRRRMIGIGLAIVGFLYVYMLSMNKGMVRLAFMTRPVMNLVAAATVVLYLKKMGRERIISPVILCFMVLMLMLSASYLKRYRGYLLFPHGLRNLLVIRHNPHIEEAERINQNTNPDDRILCDVELRYRALRREFIPQHFSQFCYGNVDSFYFDYEKRREAGGDLGFGQYLLREGITHIYTDKPVSTWGMEAEQVSRFNNRGLYRLGE